MKIVLAVLLGLSLLSVPVRAESWPVQVRTSLSQQLFYFLECLDGNPYQSTLLAAAFRRVRPEFPVASVLEPYQRFSRSATKAGEMPGSRSLKDVLERMAVDASDCEDFLQRSRELLDDAQQADLAEAVRTLRPVFVSALWEANRPELERQAAQLRQEIERSGMRGELARCAHLLDSRWSEQDAFVISLVSIPSKPVKGVASFAHSLGYLQVVEALQGENMSHRLAVVFHESLHCLWGAQRPEKRAELRAAFTGVGGRLAWQELNEGMATALGNGLFQKKLDGKLPPHPWYSDTTIDAYAGPLAELLEGYLRANRVLDRDFALQAQGALLRACPKAETDVRMLLRHVTADLPAGTALQDYLSRRTRVGSWSARQGEVKTALLLVGRAVGSDDLPAGAEAGQVWCRLSPDYWTVFLVGQEADWKSGLDRLLQHQQMVEGRLP